MSTTINTILSIIGIVALLYGSAAILVYLYHLIKYQYSVIKVVISRNKRLKRFYFLIQNHQSDLKPFLEDLDFMINKFISVPITFAERNLILDRYHFYKDILDRIADKQKVRKIDLIEFARLHKEYSDVVRDFKRMNNDKFYEENKFFDINLN